VNKDDLTIPADLMQSGKVTPVIDRRYSLQSAQDAIRYLSKDAREERSSSSWMIVRPWMPPG
jgi:hypothetical protein